MPHRGRAPDGEGPVGFGTDKLDQHLFSGSQTATARIHPQVLQCQQRIRSHSSRFDEEVE